MNTKIDLATARQIISAALALDKKAGLSPLTVVVAQWGYQAITPTTTRRPRLKASNRPDCKHAEAPGVFCERLRFFPGKSVIATRCS